MYQKVSKDQNNNNVEDSDNDLDGNKNCMLVSHGSIFTTQLYYRLLVSSVKLLESKATPSYWNPVVLCWLSASVVEFIASGRVTLCTVTSIKLWVKKDV